MPGFRLTKCKNAMVGPAEVEPGQHVVRIADEVAIGEEQQLDDVPRSAPGTGALGSNRPESGRLALEKFMSAMLTYSGFIVTQSRRLERKDRTGPPGFDGRH